MLETIAVECCPLSATSFEEVLQVFVSNTEDGENCGELVKLSVTGCIPRIDFCDMDAIFKENIMVESLTDLKCPPEVGLSCVGETYSGTRGRVKHFGAVLA